MFFAAPHGGNSLALRCDSGRGTKLSPHPSTVLAVPSEQTLRENLVRETDRRRNRIVEETISDQHFHPVRYHEAVPSFYVENFGCRATQADGAAIERQFRSRGLDHASSPASAELVVLNTCTVTASADRDARAAIRRIRRQNPACEIVVTGCYAQRAPEEVAALPGVTRVIGNSHKHQLAEIALLQSRAAGDSGFVPLSALRTGNGELTTIPQRPTTDDQRLFVSDIFAHTELLAAPVFEAGSELTESARIRPNLKVQDGCDNRCSFCIIPSVRGQSRSLPVDRILAEVNALVAAGYREVVISGINLGRWGRDLPVWGGHSCPPSFEALVGAILSETTLEKLRLSSIEPMDWSDDLIALMSNSPRIAKHAHVPLQSGSDRILRLMHRKYRPWHYRQKIEKIRSALPTAAIGADVMAGFPGETESDFEQTRRLIEDLPFTYLHVFTYSSRPGTPSAAMRYQIPVHIARERNRILRDLASEKKLAFMRSFIGKRLEAITLQASSELCHSEPPATAHLQGESVREISEPAFTEALTDNYLKLHLQGRHDPNRWLTATVERVDDGMLVGTAS